MRQADRRSSYSGKPSAMPSNNGRPAAILQRLNEHPQLAGSCPRSAVEAVVCDQFTILEPLAAHAGSDGPHDVDSVFFAEIVSGLTNS